jgi:beta-glucanase (GH16 family)
MNLKYLFVTVMLLVIVCQGNLVKAQDKNAPACPLGAGWKFIPEFSDEFNGQGLDREKWWDFNPTMHGRKPAFFSRENVRVKDGNLELWAKVQQPEEVTEENRVRGYDKFTTSIIKSKKRIRYGYFEVRCKGMKAGASSAFWLYDPLDAPAKYREGSFSEEIDIFEIIGLPSQKEFYRKYSMTVHRQKTPYVETLVRSAFPLENKTSSYTVPFDFYDDFHLYGFLWTPEEMKWYVDGKEVFSRKNDYFHTALNICLDSEIMESWAGLPDPADLPAAFYVDYCRIWQSDEMK